MRQLLSGIKVVELAEGIAGSYCGKLFADLGADVLKVEAPYGDELRHRESAAPMPDGLFRGGAFLHLNTNKRSAVRRCGDGRRGRAQWKACSSGAHLVIEETGRGRLRTWGMTWSLVHELWPALSVVSISGFGATGPYAEYAWDDLVVQTMSDALVRPRSDDGPVRLPGHLALHLVGNMAALGALAAVIGAESTRTGCFVDCAALEVLATLPARATTLLAHQYRDGAPGPSLVSAARETLIPGGVHPCADGYVSMMSTPQQLGELLDVLDDDALREAFARPDAFERGETKEAMDAALYPWLLARTRAEATAEAQRAGWPLAGVNTPAEVLEAEHFWQRGFWVHTDDPGAGPINLPGPPCRFAEGGWSLRRMAPDLGEHDGEWTSSPGDRPQRSAWAQPAGVASARPPLSGVRIVDLTTVWSGPYATMLLADLGAEVIRVENPWVLPPTTKGYQARPTISNPGFLGSLYGPGVPDRPDRPWNRHAMNNSLARNKLSCTIDTRRPEGRELLMRLAEHSDVFIDNFKSGGLARIGIQTSELQARNPRLVVVRMPATGLTGDWSGYTGFGAQFDGLTGMLWLCGHPDSDLVDSPGTTYMDAASGPGAAFATVAALRYRAGHGARPIRRVRPEREHPQPPRRRLGRLPVGGGTKALGESGPLAGTAGALPLPGRGPVAGHLGARRRGMACPRRSHRPGRPRARPPLRRRGGPAGASRRHRRDHRRLGGRAVLARRLSHPSTGGGGRRSAPRRRDVRGRSPPPRPCLAAAPPQSRRGHPPAPRSAVPRCPPGVATGFARPRRGQRVRLQGHSGRLGRGVRALPAGEDPGRGLPGPPG